jgi:hypothetical protein
MLSRYASTSCWQLLRQQVSLLPVVDHTHRPGTCSALNAAAWPEPVCCNSELQESFHPVLCCHRWKPGR